MTQSEPTVETATSEASLKWLTSGVRGIGLASFLADMGHEVPTALFASLVVSVLGASAAVLGLIEGLADGLAGLARLLGGPLADDPASRRKTAIGYVEKNVSRKRFFLPLGLTLGTLVLPTF